MEATKEALIQKTPGVMGGEACIRRTLTPVWKLVDAWNIGLTDDQLLSRFTSLSREELAAVKEYYTIHKAEVDEDVHRYEARRVDDGTTTDTWIQKKPGVLGGEACIRNMRIAVWMLVNKKRMGMTDEDILSGYPLLTQDDLNAAWAYDAEHREEIDEAIRQNEELEPDEIG